MKKLFAILFLCMALIGYAHAAEVNVFQEQYDALNLNSLEHKVPSSSKLEDYPLNISEDISLDKGLGALLKRFLGEIGSVFSRSISCITIIIAIAVLSAIIRSMYNTGSSTVPTYITVVSALAVTAAASGSITSLIGMGGDAIENMDAFSKALLPTLSAAVAATGSPVGATVRYAATVLFSDIVISIISMVLLPLIYAYIAAATANAALENATLKKLADFLQWIVTGSLKILITIFVAYITVSGIISSTTDVVGAKTAKFAINGAVPVVGSILSDAAETVIAGAMVVKNSIGVFGMLTILSICLTPFLTIGVNYFLFKVASAVTAPICDIRISHLVDQIGNSFGAILAMTASCALLMFISILSCMMAVGAA